MKVNPSKRYLRLAKVKLIKMQESDFCDIDSRELCRICFNLNKIKVYENSNNTLREVIDLMLTYIKEVS